MFKKLGMQIVIITSICIAVVVAVMLTVTIIAFHGYNDKIMLERAVVGMQVLVDKVQSELDDLADAYSMFKEDGDFRDAAEAANEEILKAYMQKQLPGEDFYMVVGDKSGNITYKTANYPLKSFDYAQVGAGKTIKGIARCDGELVAMYASYVVDQDGQEFMLCVGFTMEAYDWLDEVMKTSNCDATVWNWNIRYATTLKRDNGERATGTDLNEDVAEAVLNKNGKYEGQHDVVDRHYYVSYQTMTDYDGKIVGAYWAGADAREADAEFGKVTAIAIVIGVIGAIGIALFIFIFCQMRVTTPLAHAEQYANEMLEGQLATTNVTYKFADDCRSAAQREARHERCCGRFFPHTLRNGKR